MTASITIPVAFGELIDKITILEIKAERIADPARLGNVRHELDLLNTILNGNAHAANEDLAELRRNLKNVNQTIWDAEDVVHGPDADTLNDAAFLAQARIAFAQNDARARLKRQITSLAGSDVVEEKSYPDFL